MDNFRIQVTRAVGDYLAATGMSARQFGILSVGSEHFLRRLKGGKSIRLGTVERAISWMVDHPPGGWPESDAGHDELTSA